MGVEERVFVRVEGVVTVAGFAGGLISLVLVGSCVVGGGGVGLVGVVGSVVALAEGLVMFTITIIPSTTTMSMTLTVALIVGLAVVALIIVRETLIPASVSPRLRFRLRFCVGCFASEGDFDGCGGLEELSPELSTPSQETATSSQPQDQNQNLNQNQQLLHILCLITRPTMPGKASYSPQRSPSSPHSPN